MARINPNIWERIGKKIVGSAIRYLQTAKFPTSPLEAHKRFNDLNNPLCCFYKALHKRAIEDENFLCELGEERLRSVDVLLLEMSESLSALYIYRNGVVTPSQTWEDPTRRAEIQQQWEDSRRELLILFKGIHFRGGER